MSDQPSSTSQVALVNPNLVPQQRPSLEKFLEEQIARFHSEISAAMRLPSPVMLTTSGIALPMIILDRGH